MILEDFKNMNDILNQLEKCMIVPVVVLENAKDAKPLGEALCNGGLPCAEVTFRTEAAEESIRIMSESFPEMLVGAGTVLTTEQVDRAVNAGAKFIVSPGFDEEIVDYCLEKGITGHLHSEGLLPHSDPDSYKAKQQILP